MRLRTHLLRRPSHRPKLDSRAFQRSAAKSNCHLSRFPGGRRLRSSAPGGFERRASMSSASRSSLTAIETLSLRLVWAHSFSCVDRMAFTTKFARSVIRSAVALLIFPLFKHSSAASRILRSSCEVISISSLIRDRTFVNGTSSRLGFSRQSAQLSGSRSIVLSSHLRIALPIGVSDHGRSPNISRSSVRAESMSAHRDRCEPIVTRARAIAAPIVSSEPEMATSSSAATQASKARCPSSVISMTDFEASIEDNLTQPALSSSWQTGGIGLSVSR